ncbi:family 16 glycoside hydrolase [Nocardia sp. NPDC004722]
MDCRPESGYTTLYDGSTTGWTHAGPGGFSNTNDTLTSYGGMGLLSYTPRQYASYSLKVDWMPAATGGDNSGIFIGFPISDDPESAVEKGFEVQIETNPADPISATGAIYGVQAPDVAARDAALNPRGEWNEYEILVEGDRVRVYLNGSLVNDFTNTDPNRSVAGHIGIQNHSDSDVVSFRNIRIKELGAIPVGQTVQAANVTSANGPAPFAKPEAQGGYTLGFIEPGSWASYANMDLTGASTFKARVFSGGSGGAIEVRADSETGPVLGSVAVPNTGDWNTFADVSTTLAGVPSGVHTLFLTFTGTDSGMFDVDTFTLLR